jgi:hypothetical protein
LRRSNCIAQIEPYRKAPRKEFMLIFTRKDTILSKKMIGSEDELSPRGSVAENSRPCIHMLQVQAKDTGTVLFQIQTDSNAKNVRKHTQIKQTRCDPSHFTRRDRCSLFHPSRPRVWRGKLASWIRRHWDTPWIRWFRILGLVRIRRRSLFRQ